jgi:hypothetical protein
MWNSNGIENWHEEFCSVFHFVWAKHDSPIEIQHSSIEMYIDSILRVCHDRPWHKGFKNGQTNTHEVIMSVGVTHQLCIWREHGWCNQFWENRCTTIPDLPVALGLSVGTVPNIAHVEMWCMSLMSTTAVFLNACQDGTDVWIWSGIMLKNSDMSVE